MSTRTVDLDVEGMTCASCVNHVTKSLQAIPGVSAAVNLATERAVVDAPENIDNAALLAAIESAGYHARVHADEHEHEHLGGSNAVTLVQRLVIASILTVPVLLISMIPAWQFDYWQYLMFVLATPVVWWAGWPFHRSAWASLKHRTSSMDTLVSVGTLAAWGWSVWAIMFGHAAMIGMRHEWSLFPSAHDPSANIYFETAAVLITVILLGRWLEERSRRTAGAALRELSKLLPGQVFVLGDDGSEHAVNRAEVRVGQRVVVRAGETVAVDGTVCDGHGYVDASVVTGESAPISVHQGSELMAGTIVLDARIVLEASKVGDDTRIAQLTRLVDNAQVAKSSAQRLADRISAVFVPTVLGLSLLTGIAWWVFSANLGMAFSVAIAVVIIACPCALGLATPVAIMAGTGRGAQLGIIVSGPDAIEQSGALSKVFLDKTGTLTTGTFALETVKTIDGVTADEALGLLASVEAGSTHPIAQAAIAVAAERAIRTQQATDVSVIAGAGVAATVAERRIEAIAPHRFDGVIPTALQVESVATAVLIVRDGSPVALATFGDLPKPDASETIAELERLGLQPELLTGDRAEVAASVAASLGISRVQAELTPEAKLAIITKAQQQGSVAMVGDGINDAAALAQANLGIAIGAGTDLARAASDITVLRTDSLAIAQSIRLAKATRRVIIGNLVWAFGYNVAAIPLAMAGMLGPMIAGAAMAFSSVFVVLNSVRLTRFK